jgi:ABC-2 type transport system permease protein
MMRFLWLDYLSTLRERKIWVAAAMMLYAVLSIPVLLERPPKHVRDAITAWFGNDDPFVVFMFVWIDLAMNKALVVLPVIFGSSVVLRERDTGVLPLLAAKPMSMSRYFVIRTLSACAVMLTLFWATQWLGIIWFSGRITGFRSSTFAAAMSLHSFAAVFATAFSATLMVTVGRRVVGTLVSLLVLGLLVGLGLVGFYQPAWYTFTLANPMTLGALSLGQLDHLTPGVLLPPMLALSAMSIIVIAVGSTIARRVEA